MLLVNPWIHDFAAYNLWARPMGLLVLGTRLRRLGWEPQLLDFLDPSDPDAPRPKPMAHGKFHRTVIPKPEPLQDIPRRLSRYGLSPAVIDRELRSLPTPAAILITGVMTYWYTGLQETVRVLRDAFPGVPLLLGGVYATLMPEHARRSCDVDMVWEGPGEQELSEMLYRVTGLRPSGGEADSDLEFTPALDLLRRVEFMPLLTSRGCPMKCAYCASRRLVSGFVQRPPRLVIDEIAKGVANYGITDVALYDDAFLIQRAQHALPLLRGVAERIPGLRWHSPNGLHAAAIDLEVAQAMKKTGFKTIRLGLESSSDAFHERTGHKTTRMAFLTAVGNLREAGFSREDIGAYLLVGFPGQSREAIEGDVELVLRAGAVPKLAEYSPIPGTALWDAAVKTSRYPIQDEPLYQNCTLLSCAEPEVDWVFLQRTRSRIRGALPDPAGAR
ncbi:MAG: B12-binding domain-containing radical SAM protein [Thermodesulfobacteriota bacterium]